MSAFKSKVYKPLSNDTNNTESDNQKSTTTNAKRNKRIAVITIYALCVIVAFFVLLNSVIIPEGKYNDAMALLDEGKYNDAILAFEALNGYKDSINKIDECNNAIIENKYDSAVALMNEGKYTEAISAFEALNGYKDSINKIDECNNAIIENKYDSAVALMNEGKYTEAISAFEALDGYKDCADKIEKCNINIYGEETWKKIKNINIGDTYKFGTYEQDNDISNGKEDIEWLVLSKAETKVLIISKYALDCKMYNTSYGRITWESSMLRHWLNSEFFNSAFSDDERKMIQLTDVSAGKNPDSNVNPGNATQDNIFLLSIDEANKYLSSDSARECKPTPYAIYNGAYVSNSDGNCWWWLRSPGSGQYFDAAGVNTNGAMDNYGRYVNNNSCAVRPVLWIDIS